MTCQDCSSLSIQADSLRRRLDSAEADLKEAGAEIDGLRADNARLRENMAGLAAQVNGGIP